MIGRDRRLSMAAKNANEKQWYKDTVNFLDHKTTYNTAIFYDSTDYIRKKVNYDLYNGVIDRRDFEYVVRPLGSEVGELPADFTNKDIVSNKIKVLLGMEMERPFSYRIFAVNEDATTRREQEAFRRYREYVIQQIMLPIQQEVQMKYAQAVNGQNLSPQQTQQIQQQIQQEIQAQTPEEVMIYMKRKHQDPAEVMASQILSYIVNEQDCQRKFNKGWKHAMLSAYEIHWLCMTDYKPLHYVINPMYFDFDKAQDVDFIEDGEWAGVELWLSPTQVVEMFGDELTDEQIDKLYDEYNTATIRDTEFTFDSSNNYSKVRVLHREWKALERIGFLTYVDETGMIQMTLVGEDFKMDKSQGHINIEWKWLPRVYEGYKINRDTFVRLRPVPGQVINMDNPYECKLRYMGAIYDNLNSQPTAPMDRMKVYQYYYNIIMYRIELLMASDKGKLLLMNMNMIPQSQKIDMSKWLYYAEALKIGFLNPNEEGNRGDTDISNSAKEIDMSLATDIEKYIRLAEYIELRCGASVGVTKEMEGRIGQYQTAQTADTALNNSGYVIEPYFELHNTIKRNVLTALLNLAKYCYSVGEKKYLDYVLDDFSREMIRLDKDMLSISHYGLFVTDSMKSNDVKKELQMFAHAAMQNQMIEMSDVVKVLRAESIPEAEEFLSRGEDRMQERKMQIEQEKTKGQMELLAKQEEISVAEHERNKEIIILKEKERRQTEIQKQVILSMGFNENKDINENQVPDILEVAKEGIEIALKQRKQALDERKLEHTIEHDNEKLEIERQKLSKSTNNK